MNKYICIEISYTTEEDALPEHNCYCASFEEAHEALNYLESIIIGDT